MRSGEQALDEALEVLSDHEAAAVELDALNLARYQQLETTHPADAEKVRRVLHADEQLLGKATEVASGVLSSAALGSRNLGETAHRLQLADVVDAIVKDRSPAIRGEDGLAALNFVLAAYESARSGTDIAL